MAVLQFDDPDFWTAFATGRMRYASAMSQAVGGGSAARSIGVADDEDDPDATCVLLYQLPPGGRLPKHAHDAHRIEIVVRGELRLENGEVLRPGDVQITKPGEFYGPANAGPDGSLAVEVLSSSGGAPMMLSDDLPPEDVEMMRTLHEARAKALAELGYDDAAP